MVLYLKKSFSNISRCNFLREECGLIVFYAFHQFRFPDILGPPLTYIYIFIAITLDESIFLDVLHFPMKSIKSRDLEATPMGGATSKPDSDVVCLLLLM